MSDRLELDMSMVDNVSILTEPEQIKFKGPFTNDQIRELERLWAATPPGQRLEVVAAKAAELGVEVESMSRVRR